MADRLLIADRDDVNHDPIETAEWLDKCGDRTGGGAEDYHDAADVVRGLVALVLHERASMSHGRAVEQRKGLERGIERLRFHVEQGHHWDCPAEEPRRRGDVCDCGHAEDAAALAALDGVDRV